MIDINILKLSKYFSKFAFFTYTPTTLVINSGHEHFALPNKDLKSNVIRLIIFNIFVTDRSDFL